MLKELVTTNHRGWYCFGTMSRREKLRRKIMNFIWEVHMSILVSG